MKYSGAKYPNVPSIGITAWWVHLLGSHFASPKSVIYTQIKLHLNLEGSITLSSSLHWSKLFASSPVVHNLVLEGHLRLLCLDVLFGACNIYVDNSDPLQLQWQSCIWLATKVTRKISLKKYCLRGSQVISKLFVSGILNVYNWTGHEYNWWKLRNSACWLQN